jgi:hypothetical protein
MRTRLHCLRLYLGFLAVPFLLPAPVGAPDGKTAVFRPDWTPSRSSARLNADFGKIPLQFIPNRGQKDGPVAYSLQGRDKTIYFSAEGLTYVLMGRTGEGGKRKPDSLGGSGTDNGRRWVVKLDFVDSNRNAGPAGLETSGTLFSYFKGKPAEWKTGLPAYSKIAYRDLWPGIDLVYSGTFSRMKYEFIVHPGADPSRIRLSYRGAEEVGQTADGRLTVRTPAGGFEDGIPVAYQELDGKRLGVPVKYDLKTAAGNASRSALTSREAPGRGLGEAECSYGFSLGKYDPTRTLVLDPTVLVYCGFIGGAGTDEGLGIAVDGQGNAYVAGWTQSDAATFPVSVGPDLTHSENQTDGFVAKVRSDGTGLVYCGYIHSAPCRGIAVDGAGNAYITGATSSSVESGFPAAVGPDLTFNGGVDAFVAKVDASGTALAYCGYIGGDINADDKVGDIGNGIAVDAVGNAYVVGTTDSAESSFPLIVGPDLTFNQQPGYWRYCDAFVAKVNASGTALDYCGYIGSTWADFGNGIAVDAGGNAYVTGTTYWLRNYISDFPVTVGPDLTHNGYNDAFVAKVNASGTALDYCGFIGGAGWDEGHGIAVDGLGNAYITGLGSDDPTFPVTTGPNLTGSGAFVAKVDPSGASFSYCRFIGPGNAFGIAVDGSGNAYVAGETSATEADFPVTVGPDLTHNSYSGSDAFVAKINVAGTALDYCGFIGGSGTDAASGIALDASGNAYVVGTTTSIEFRPEYDYLFSYFPVKVGPDLSFNSPINIEDAFVAKIPPNPVAIRPALTAVIPDSCTVGEQSFTFAVEGSDFDDGARVKWHGDPRPTTFISSTRLEAAIDTVHLATAESVEITVQNNDGEATNPLTFSINNPLPSLTSISPTAVTGGGPDFRLTLSGSNFFGSPVVRWNGVDMAMSGTAGYTEMWAEVPTSQLATGGEIQITVYNPPPGGGTSNALVLPVSTFNLSPSPGSATVNAGQSATYTIQLTPQFGSFDAPVAFINNTLPTGCTAVYLPANVTPGSGPVTTTLTISTKARSGSTTGSALGAAGSVPPALGPGLLLAALCFLLWLGSRQSGHGRLFRRWVMAAALICLFITLGSCGGGAGGGNNPPPATGTPAGTYQITLAGRSGSMTVPTTVTLIVN